MEQRIKIICISYYMHKKKGGSLIFFFKYLFHFETSSIQQCLLKQKIIGDVTAGATLENKNKNGKQ